MALKENQETLHHNGQLSFVLAQQENDAPTLPDRVQTVDNGHGRIETRRACVIDHLATLAWLQERHTRRGLHAIGWV